jgi:hypothetical protein
MTLTFGKEGVFPMVEVQDVLGGEPMFRIWDADLTAPEISGTPHPGLLSHKFDDVLDDEHDHSYSIRLELASFNVALTYGLGLLGTGYLGRAEFYDDDLTLEQWAEQNGQTLEECDPKTCPHKKKSAHRAGAPFVPPRRTIKGPSDYKKEQWGPRFVQIDFRWRKR